NSHTPGLDMGVEHIGMFSLVMYCMIIVVGTVGNGLVIYVTVFQRKKTVNSVWFLNLALADFLFTAFLVFTAVSLSQQHHWPFGEFMCKLNNFVSLVNMFASVFFLTAISLDRCLSIWVVVWAQNKRTVGKAQVISAVIWLAAGICIKNKHWTLCIFRFVMGFLIPFLAIFFSHVAIGIRARRLQRMRKQRRHRIIFAIIFAFFICWLPFHVLGFIQLKFHHYSDIQNIVQVIGPLTVSLAFINSCLNPILYVFMCDEFQKKLKQSICFVIESTLAEDHVLLGSSHSHVTGTPQRCTVEEKQAVTSPTFIETKLVSTEIQASSEEDFNK
uniref:G-protein coupled receptors family 1 profile domain-containing protein n=1 Tax=Xiphophorus couchianus TaxID=32473 RepID=A0A3B5KVT0_9TELE